MPNAALADTAKQIDPTYLKETLLRFKRDNLIETIVGEVPLEWRTEVIGKISIHINSVLDHLDEFLTEILGILQ